MEKSLTTIPGYRINEYKLVLDPHAELQHKIANLKREFNKEYNISTPVSAKINLALVTFSQYELMEERIVNHLKTIAMGYPPFKVELKEFGSFPSHSIFINVVSKIPIQNLIKLVRHETGRLMKLNDEHKPHFISEPFIHIASKLKPWQYEKGWLAYSHKHFTGRFISDAMLLLKRRPDEKHWQIVRRFEFQNMPLTVKQGDLF